MKRELVGLGMAVVLCGCGQYVEKRFFPKPTARRCPRKSTVWARPTRRIPICNRCRGARYGRSDDHVFFYGDKKALRVGDIITVRIVENAEASNTADTDLSRSSSANAGLSTFFGKKKFLNLFKLGEDLLTSTAENTPHRARARQRAAAN